MNAPPLYGDWPALAAAAEQLLAGRVANDPAAIEAGKLTPDQAEERARIMAAVVAIWRAVVRREPVPELQAPHAEIRHDLARAREALSVRVAAAPGNTTLAQQLHLAVALEWNHRPCMPGHDLPWILHVHLANQLARERHPLPKAA